MWSHRAGCRFCRATAHGVQQPTRPSSSSGRRARPGRPSREPQSHGLGVSGAGRRERPPPYRLSRAESRTQSPRRLFSTSARGGLRVTTQSQEAERVVAEDRAPVGLAQQVGGLRDEAYLLRVGGPPAAQSLGTVAPPRQALWFPECDAAAHRKEMRPRDNVVGRKSRFAFSALLEREPYTGMT